MLSSCVPTLRADLSCDVLDDNAIVLDIFADAASTIAY